MHKLPAFGAQHVESVARLLGDTAEGLTGSEIGHFLLQCEMADPSAGMTKWKRLHNAFVDAQNQHRVGNHLVMFINRVMNPVRYTKTPQEFRRLRDELNIILAFAGLQVGEDGKVHFSQAVATLDQALQRANRLHAALKNRGVHQDVLRYCRAELLQNNYFHAVLEAVKSIAAKIRGRSGCVGDGAELAQCAFAIPKDGGPPRLAMNDLVTETDRGEQRGFMNLLIGLFGTIRNPLAHNPKIEWPMEEDDALDILTLASLVHRKLDRARISSP